MKAKIFIDGKEGTTGLKIFERFEGRDDIEILQIDDDKRKNPAEKAKLINASDYTFLCLPDQAAIEAAALCTNPETTIIDASTAHRTNPDWAYGFPELDKSFEEKIFSSKRIAVPGCYASGSIAILYPLVKSGIMPSDYPVVIHSVSGYSGAGKKGIAQYEDENRNPELDSPRLYAMTQNHKHLPEIKKHSGLDFEPIFNPYICDYFQGMSVTVGLHAHLLSKKVTANDVWEMFKNHYEGGNANANQNRTSPNRQSVVDVISPANGQTGATRYVHVAGFMGEGVLTEQFIAANTLAETNDMQVFVYGNDDRIMITTRFDNLGKGASGAAVQCLDLKMRRS